MIARDDGRYVGIKCDRCDAMAPPAAEIQRAHGLRRLGWYCDNGRHLCPAHGGQAMTVDETIAERGNSYGEYKDGTKIAMNLFNVVQAAPGYAKMSSDKQYAMFMFCAKMARVLNGDPEHKDSYHDIAGYAKLVEDRCQVVPPMPAAPVFGSDDVFSQ